MKAPSPIEMEQAQVEQLIGKAEQGTLDAGEQKRLVPLLKTLVWLQHTLLETRISLSKLKRILFGEKTEKRPRKPKDPDKGPDGDGQGSDEGRGSHEPPDGAAEPSCAPPQGEQSGAKKPCGHGRRAAAKLLQRQLAAFVIEFFETIKTIATVAHDLTGLRDITELFAQF